MVRRAGGLERRSLEYDGRERSYYLVRPNNMDGLGPVPLVLALHGGGGNGRGMCRTAGGIQLLVDAEGFLVACPEGIDHHWNDGRQVESRQTVRENVDDVGFLLALIEGLKSEYPIDENRIYVTGVSNGGMMSLRMACDGANVFAAAAPVIAELPAALDCDPANPISVMLMDGTMDPLVPWDGGQVHFLRQELGQVLSTESTVSFWVNANRCPFAPTNSYLPDRDPKDGTRIRVESHESCADDTRVLLYAVEGGGHTWPGGPQYAPRFLVGKVSKDAVAGELIWSFFTGSTRSSR